MEFEQLKLDNQLCFPVYAASRLIIREYQPSLEKLEITYPQYLVLMVLWETDRVSVNDVAEKLILKTNTVTPLLKRMESQGLIKRSRSDTDERKVMIRLTGKGRRMQKRASSIPEMLATKLKSGTLSMNQLIELRSNLDALIDLLNKKEEPGRR